MIEVAEKLKQLFHQTLEERDWEKVAGDIIQLAQASLEPVMKTYTKEQIAEALRATFKTNDKLAEVLMRLDLPAPAFKEGDRVCLEKGEWGVPSGTEGVVKRDFGFDNLVEVYFMFIGSCMLVPRNRLRLVEPQFKEGDRVRIESYPGSLQGQLGYVYEVVDGSNCCIVHCDDGSFCPIHISWLTSLTQQFKDGQRVRVRATGQVGRVKAVLVDGRFLVEGFASVLQAVGLEPAPFKDGDRVRWKLGSGLPWNYGAVEYLLNERVGVRTDGQLVEVAERLLEADPAWWKKWIEANPVLDPADYLAASPLFCVGDRVRRKTDGAEGRVTQVQVKTGGLVTVAMDNGAYLANWEPDKFKMLEPTPTFRVGDRVRWRGTVQTGVVSGVRAFGKLDVALDNGGRLSDYSPDNFELLKPAGPRRFVEDLVSRMVGVVFTHEEAEHLRLQIALRTRV